MRGRTVIEIAHNASAIQDADQVIVLDCGQVVASGPREEMEKSNTFYRQLLSKS